MVHNTFEIAALERSIGTIDAALSLFKTDRDDLRSAAESCVDPDDLKALRAALARADTRLLTMLQSREGLARRLESITREPA